MGQLDVDDTDDDDGDEQENKPPPYLSSFAALLPRLSRELA